jgi:hypothetical protein
VLAVVIVRLELAAAVLLAVAVQVALAAAEAQFPKLQQVAEGTLEHPAHTARNVIKIEQATMLDTWFVHT